MHHWWMLNNPHLLKPSETKTPEDRARAEKIRRANDEFFMRCLILMLVLPIAIILVICLFLL